MKVCIVSVVGKILIMKKFEDEIFTNLNVLNFSESKKWFLKISVRV